MAIPPPTDCSGRNALFLCSAQSHTSIKYLLFCLPPVPIILFVLWRQSWNKVLLHQTHPQQMKYIWKQSSCFLVSWALLKSHESQVCREKNKMKNPKQKISHHPWVLPLHLLEWVSWPVAHTPCPPWASLLSPQLWGALPWTSAQQMLGLQQRWPVPGGLLSSCGGLGVLLQGPRSAAGEPACCPDPSSLLHGPKVNQTPCHECSCRLRMLFRHPVPDLPCGVELSCLWSSGHIW